MASPRLLFSPAAALPRSASVPLPEVEWEMAEASRMLYIEVVDGGDGGAFRYTRPVLQGTLQLMGCKARHAFKMSKYVFDAMRSKVSDSTPQSNASALEAMAGKEEHFDRENASDSDQENADADITIPFELYKTQTTVVLTREEFLDVVCDALSMYKYVGPNQRADFLIACRIRERKESITILLCGTSGCGKSTLSSLLGSRLGITTVVSTDSIRHMMRGFVDEKQDPLVWASTYHAGECLDPVAVSQAKARRKAKKLAGISHSGSKVDQNDASNCNTDRSSTELAPGVEIISQKQLAIEGFKAQSEMVIGSLDRLITSWEERKESVIVEGVHLSLNFVMGLMKKHPSIIPFMIYITNEEKHLERFAVRAKYMTLDPSKNKYVKYIKNIRAIQEYLCNRADKHLVPKINNTNVDRSVATIHATVFGCLRRREAGDQLYDPETNTVTVVDEEYRNQLAANSLGSKKMFQLIQRKGSSRHLMAILNTDGSVAKAWPIETDNAGDPTEKNSSSKRGGSIPTYGPVQIGKAEPVNLQFGSFGLSAWPIDTGASSHAGSAEDYRADGTDTGSRYLSSCCSSPKSSVGLAKELKENLSVSGSEDEHLVDRDEDLTSDDDDDSVVLEVEGSVDENSTKSDEEYDDLAMREDEEFNFLSDDDEAKKENSAIEAVEDDASGVAQRRMYLSNVDRFLKTMPRHYPSLNTKARKRTLSDPARIQGNEQSTLLLQLDVRDGR